MASAGAHEVPQVRVVRHHRRQIPIFKPRRKQALLGLLIPGHDVAPQWLAEHPVGGGWHRRVIGSGDEFVHHRVNPARPVQRLQMVCSRGAKHGRAQVRQVRPLQAFGHQQGVGGVRLA